jgi:hypothetical protein
VVDRLSGRVLPQSVERMVKVNLGKSKDEERDLHKVHVKISFGKIERKKLRDG